MTRTVTFIIVAIYAFNVFGQTFTVIPQESAKKTDFEQFLTASEKWADNFDNADFYGEIVNKDDKDDKMKVSDLPKFDQDTLFLLQGKKLSVKLLKMDVLWKLYADNIKDPSDDEPTTADTKKYIKQLTEIRKKLAVKYEAFLKKMAEEHKLPQPEKELLLERVREFHQMQGLIPR